MTWRKSRSWRAEHRPLGDGAGSAHRTAWAPLCIVCLPLIPRSPGPSLCAPAPCLSTRPALARPATIRPPRPVRRPVPPPPPFDPYSRPARPPSVVPRLCAGDSPTVPSPLPCCDSTPTRWLPPSAFAAASFTVSVSSVDQIGACGSPRPVDGPPDPIRVARRHPALTQRSELARAWRAHERPGSVCAGNGNEASTLERRGLAGERGRASLSVQPTPLLVVRGVL